MKSEDDPEARIRALEQPLADAARASEISANPPPGKWAPPSGPPMPPPSSMPPSGPPMPPPSSMPPPPPSMPYGGPFQYPPTGPARQGRTIWILLALFVFAMIALPIGIFMFSTHNAFRGGFTTLVPTPSMSSMSPTPSQAAPSTSVAAIPTPPTSMTTAPAGQNITVSGINEVRTIACNGGSVSVSGITNIVTVTGHCTSVVVSGIQNQVTVDTADAIQASGSENRITYHTGTPKIGQSGIGNTVQKG
jgi:hypothetical protein